MFAKKYRTDKIEWKKVKDGQVKYLFFFSLGYFLSVLHFFSFFFVCPVFFFILFCPSYIFFHSFSLHFVFVVLSVSGHMDGRTEKQFKRTLSLRSAIMSIIKASRSVSGSQLLETLSEALINQIKKKKIKKSNVYFQKLLLELLDFPIDRFDNW